MKKEVKKTADPSVAVKNQGKEQKIITTPLTKKKTKNLLLIFFGIGYNNPIIYL